MKTRKILYALVIGAMVLGLALGAFRAAEANEGVAAVQADTWLYLPLTRSLAPYRVASSAIGVDINPIRRESGIYEFAKANTGWIRGEEVLWGQVEPQKGARNWEALTSFEIGLDYLRNFGMQTVVVVRYTPTWAQKIPGVACGPIKEEELEAFGDFMYDLALRYSQPPRQVNYWEIWNEPDIRPDAVPEKAMFGCWGDPEDEFYGGGYYGEMLKVVYPRIKQANPNAQVVVGGLLLYCDPASETACPSDEGRRSMRYLEGILRRNGANDGGQYFDGISFHAYDYYYGALGLFGNPLWNARSTTTGSSVLPKIVFLRQVLSNPEYGATGKFLVNTEQALLCDPNTKNTQRCDPSPESDYEQTKAYYLVRSYAAGLSEGLTASFWFRGWGEWRNSQLLNEDRSPRPGYTALQVFSQAIGGSQPLGLIEGYPGLDGFMFQRGDRQIWLIYSMDGADHEINFANLPEKAYDIYGVTVPVSTTLTIGLQPLYLEWLP